MFRELFFGKKKEVRQPVERKFDPEFEVAKYRAYTRDTSKVDYSAEQKQQRQMDALWAGRR